MHLANKAFLELLNYQFLTPQVHMVPNDPPPNQVHSFSFFHSFPKETSHKLLNILTNQAQGPK